MTWRCECSFVFAVVVVAWLASCPLAVWGAEPPEISHVRVDMPFERAYPGNSVTVTLEATDPRGVQEVRLRIHFSKYEGGHGELMTPEVMLKATGQANERQGSFVVPAIDHNTQQPLPAGTYRVSLTSFVDSQGEGVGHRYIIATYINFDPNPVVRVLPHTSIPSQPNAIGQASVVIENPTSSTQNIPLQIRVYDHFQQVVASRDETLNLPPGKHTRELTFAAQDAKRFRTEARWRAGNDAWQTAMAYADVDYLASGPRRLRRVEEGAWQRLVPESAPPGPPVYPPQGEWTDTSFPLRPDWSETSHWTWFRQEIASEQWLAGDTVELRIAQADFHCHVYLNGEKVGQHMGAATPFSFDVTAQWKFNQLNLLEIAVGSFTTTFADFSKDEWYNCLTPGVSSRRAQLGIWEGVAVVAHAGVFIDDVFVMPSVQKGELRVRTWLRNGGGEMARVVLRHTVEDEGKPALALPEQTVTLGPGRTRMVETIEPWAAPKLWWPHSPHLYRLRSQLASADGQPVDELSTRFGFREIRLEGMNVLFNERIFRPFSGGMGSGRPTTTRVTRDNLSEHCARKHPYPGEPLLLRTHQSPHARWQMEVADEMGVCIEAESQFNSVVVNATNDPRFWRNAAQHLREYVERDRNSPAVVLWSISNEVLHSSGVSQTPRDTLAAEMKKLAMMVKEIDPTRPVVEEGGADLDGTWEMLDMHYPRKWFNHVDFPNYCFWFEPGGMTGTGGQAPIVRWDGDKPVSIGEEGSYFQSRTPHDMATYAGDSIYTEPGGYGVSARCSEIDDMVEAGLLEAYRQVGVWRIAPDMGGSGGPQMRAAQKRVRTFAWPRDDRFLSGAIVQRRLSVFYDVLQPEELQLVWQVKSFTADRASNAVYEELVGGQQVTLQLEAGQIVHREIKFRCPAVEQPTKLRLTVQLLKEDQEVFQEEHDYWVYPVEQIELPEGAHIGLYDPSGATAEVLSEMGASDLVKIDRLEADSLAGLQALIIGEELPREPTGAKEVLAAFVQSGGKVIMLRQHQAMGLDWLPISGLRREDSMQHTYCFVRAPDHPIMAGVDDQLLRLWSPDHVVSTDTLAKHAGHNFVPIVDAGAPAGGGLAYAPVAEIVRPQGSGSYVLCQLRLAELAQTHPGARKILQNLLTYAAAPPYRTVAPAGILLADDSPYRQLLDELGVVVQDVSEGEWDGLRTIIVDEHGVEGRARDLRQFAERGGFVLIKGLDHTTQENFAGLFEPALQLVADEQTRRPVQATPDPLLAGISNEELYWERRKSRFSWNADEQIGTQVYDALIEPATHLTALYRTEARDNHNKPVESRGAGLVKIPVGQGWLVVDQVRWEAAYEPQPEGYGGRVSFAAGLKRYVSCLLTNLGVITLDEKTAQLTGHTIRELVENKQVSHDKLVKETY